jgi:hypothetical protein
MDRNVEAGGTRDRRAAGTSGVDDGVAREARPFLQQYRRDSVARPFDTSCRRRPIGNAQCARLAAGIKP